MSCSKSCHKYCPNGCRIYWCYGRSIEMVVMKFIKIIAYSERGIHEKKKVQTESISLSNFITHQVLTHNTCKQDGSTWPEFTLRKKNVLLLDRSKKLLRQWEKQQKKFLPALITKVGIIQQQPYFTKAISSAAIRTKKESRKWKISWYDYKEIILHSDSIIFFTSGIFSISVLGFCWD